MRLDWSQPGAGREPAGKRSGAGTGTTRRTPEIAAYYRDYHLRTRTKETPNRQPTTVISICKCTLLKSKMTQSRGKGAFCTGAGREPAGRRTGGGREVHGRRTGAADLEHQFATVLGTGENKLSTNRR